MGKSVEKSYQDQHGGKDGLSQSKKKSAVASLKLGSANRDKLVGLGDRFDKSQLRNLTEVSKPHSVPVMKRKFQKTAGTGAKTPTVYNLRGKDQINEGAKDHSSYNLRSKVQKTEIQSASTNTEKRKTPKTNGSKDFLVAIPKTGISKNSASKKIETAKPVTASLADIDNKNHPLTSRFEALLREPMFHIRWEGDDMEIGPLGQNCILCNKDLSGATDDDSDSDYDDDFHYDDGGDYEYDDDYNDDIMPTLLPAVDILACGHAYHTECLQKNATEEQLGDPQCVLCSKMA